MARTPPNEGFASFAEVQKHLAGISYPAAKDDLVRRAREQDAPDGVMSLIEGLEDRTYESPADVSKAVGNLRS